MRVLIVDQDRAYRQGLLYHLQVRWPEATIDEYDPAVRGPVSAELGSRGHDIILLASPLPEQPIVAAVIELVGCGQAPPIVILANGGDEFLAVETIRAGAGYYFPKDRVRHLHLVETIERLVSEVKPVFSADPFAADVSAEVKGFRALRRLHSGELSTVYLAQNAGGELAAVKVLRQLSDESDTRDRVFNRFVQEYELIAELRHPGVVSISDLGVADDHAFIIMEYLAAGSLAERLGQPLPPSRAIDYVRQIAAALGAAHAAGILHRDLKPTNTMFRADESLALIDFGLAKALRLEAAITGSARIFGTPYYMSPEQGYGHELDARADIYSLGIMFYEMLTGRLPYVGSSAFGVIYQHQQAPRPLLTAELNRYQSLIDRMFAADPQQRFPDTQALLAALEA
jgi:serine/threonine protein kinase